MVDAPRNWYITLVPKIAYEPLPPRGFGTDFIGEVSLFSMLWCILSLWPHGGASESLVDRWLTLVDRRLRGG